MIPDRLIPEIEELRRDFAALVPDLGADGGTDLLIPDYCLPSGWRPANCALLVTCPPLYPDQQPDNFWTEEGILTARGDRPNNCMGQVTKRGRVWDQYSWHWGQTPWDRDKHNMVTFVRSIRNFFLRLT